MCVFGVCMYASLTFVLFFLTLGLFLGGGECEGVR